MIKLEVLLKQSKKFLKTAKISIDKEMAPKLIEDLISVKPTEILIDFESQSPFFYLLVDALNFCFWNPDEDKKITYKHQSGSTALGYLIKEKLSSYPELFSHTNLTRSPDKILEAVLADAGGELLLKEERIKILKELGKFLKKYNFNEVVRKFQNQDVNKLANFIAVKLPYAFGDEIRKRGIKLYFYKKLRLLISDLSMLGGIPFKNIDKLLVYADYKLPQVLIHYGILKLPPKIIIRIQNKETIPHKSQEEIIIRAGTIVSASYIKKATNLSYPEIDYKLWLASKTLTNSLPHHRTLTRFY